MDPSNPMVNVVANAGNTGNTSTAVPGGLVVPGTTAQPGTATVPFANVKPAPSAALYVGDLAPDVTEPMLYEIFNAIAPVTNIRVCRNNISRISLGYAYVNFSNNADAVKAMEMLAYSSIKGRPCRIMLSQRDPSLRRSNVGNVFIKNLSPVITTRELYETFKDIGTILSCKVALDAKGVSKGYGFVHFDSEEAAKVALSINGAEFGGLEVMQYIPRAARQTADKWTNVYAKNIPKNWSKKQLDDFFTPCGEILSSTIIADENGASKGFGFVCFRAHEDAVKAVETLNGRDVDSLPNAAPAPKEAATTDGDQTPRPLKFYVGRAQKREERERLLREKAEQAKRERAQKWAGCNLYVRNLDESIDDETLRKEFAVHGTIISAKVSRDPENRSKGFGFVCFSVPEEATKARELMHRKMLQGKPLYVTLWESRDSRSARMSQSAVRNMNSRNLNNMPNGMQLPNNMNPMANMNGMNLMYPMVANAVYAGMVNNPQYANIVRQMSPSDFSNFINNIFVNNLANMMRMQIPGVQSRGPANANNNRNGVPANFNGFNPAMFLGNGLANMDPTALAAMNNQVRQQQGGNRQGQQINGQRTTVPAQATTPRMSTVAAQGKNVQARGPQQGQQARNAPNAIPANAQPNMQFRASGQARNVPDGQPDTAVPAPVVPTPKDTFAQQLANASPADRKNLIGEKLFTLIHAKQPQLAGKITGMLLDGIDDSELIHLLEAPVELEGRILEAIQVLEEHKTKNTV